MSKHLRGVVKTRIIVFFSSDNIYLDFYVKFWVFNENVFVLFIKFVQREQTRFTRINIFAKLFINE